MLRLTLFKKPITLPNDFKKFNGALLVCLKIFDFFFFTISKFDGREFNIKNLKKTMC